MRPCRQARRWASPPDPKEDCVQFLLSEPNTDKVLSIVELSFRLIDRYLRQYEERYQYDEARIDQRPDSATEELNHRFKEHAIG